MPGLLLGEQTPVVEVYSPSLLCPIPRQLGRDSLGLGEGVPFHGGDIWHAYELSWLDANGRPLVRVGRFCLRADTPNIVESKSIKLYLNSLNFHRFDSEEQAAAVITGDLAAAAGGPVRLELFAVDDPAIAGARLTGDCLDGVAVAAERGEPDRALLQPVSSHGGEHSVYSHLLRSLCPVTGQPDWASLWLHWRGPDVSRESLLRYLLGYRRHQEFHEQCVERIFCDLLQVMQPDYLFVQAFYTRRGGLDINPYRSTDPEARGLPRLNRQ